MGEENEDIKPHERSSAKLKHPSYSYKQTYRKAWEDLADFKGWLSADPQGNKSRAYCKVCNKTLHAHRISLLKHTVSLKHTKAFQKYSTSSSSSNSILASGENFQPTVESTKTIHDFQTDGENEFDNSLKNNLNEISQEKSLSVVYSSEPSDMNMDDIDPTSQNSFDIKNTRNILFKKEMTTEVVQPPPSCIEVPSSSAAKSPITTHVLDLTRGLPVSNLSVSLYQLVEGRWTHISDDVTNGDGRANNLFLKPKELKPGRYKLHFDTEKYYVIRNVNPLYPFIEITFDVRSPQEHYHIPLLMTGFGYTTYRGS